MTQIDQFESIFRAASRSLFEYSEWKVQKVLTVCDGNEAVAKKFESQIRRFVSNAFDVDAIEWKVLPGDQFSSVKQLIELVDAEQPDLVCSHRNLHIPASEYPYSLGVYIDVLSQVSTVPLLLLPQQGNEHASSEQVSASPPESEASATAGDPDAATSNSDSGDSAKPHWHVESKTVIAITDHLVDDSMIINAAIKMTSQGGTLYLAHIEDQRTYSRFMQAIDKIAEIDSEMAHEKIAERLLLEPKDFIESCRGEITEKGLGISVEPIVKMGHSLAEYKELVEAHQVDLVVIHTKDEDQLAMHGLAYPLTIELRETPMLLL